MHSDYGVVHSEIYKGFHISIRTDSDSINPREDYDHVSTMVCFHRRYNLGDNHDYENARAAIAGISDLDQDDLPENYEEALSDVYWLPLYLYDHSGITMNTTGFSCPWDSGQVGIIYVSKDAADKDWPPRDGETDEARKERILEYLKNEVIQYDNYLTGEVYGYTVSDTTEDGEPKDEVDSCWGIFGDYEENALKEAKEEIDARYE